MEAAGEIPEESGENHFYPHEAEKKIDRLKGDR